LFPPRATHKSEWFALGGNSMTSRFVLAAAAAVALACLAAPVQAGCVIAPDGKSIAVVTDNGTDEEKNCAVKCQVDSKIGVVQVSCGGNTPPRAKAHSLCEFDKPEPWYKKVISSEDTCKGAAASTAAPAAPAVAAKRDAFSCRIAADGQSVEAVISNPHAHEASCQIDCQVSTTRAGTTFSVSCSKSVAAGATDAVLCTQKFDKGKLVKMVGGKGNCQSTEVKADKDKDDDDDDVDVQNLANDPAKMREFIRKQMQK
jgi:hypothetical protein